MALNIAAEIGTTDSRIKRFDQAKQRRDNWETMWRKAYQYSIPNKEVFTEHTKGGQRNAQVYDETAVKSVPKFATRLQAALVPTWSQWAKLVPGGVIAESQAITIPDAFEHMFEGDDVEEVLEEYTDKVFHYIHHSNFNSQAFEAFQDLSISVGAMMCEADDDNVIRFTAVPLSDLYLEEGPGGSYETIWRRLKVAGRNIKRHWPGAEIPNELQQAIDGRPDQEHHIIEGVIYDPKMGLYHLTVIHEDSKADLYYENKGESSPWIVFPWSRTPGEVYGRGPIITVLPAILSLNKIWEYVLQNAAYKAGGTYTGATDGAWNPYTVRIVPGTIIPVASNDNGNPSLRELPVGGDLQYIDWLIQQKQSQVEACLFANPMGDVDDTPVRTLGENQLRVQDMLEQSGASFSLLETEFVAKVMKRVIYLLVEAGKLPELKIDGESITLKMQSPIAQARDAQELQSLNLFTSTVGVFGPEAMAINVNATEAFKMAQRAAGLPEALINDEEAQKEMINQMQEMAQGGV